MDSLKIGLCLPQTGNLRRQAVSPSDQGSLSQVVFTSDSHSNSPTEKVTNLSEELSLLAPCHFESLSSSGHT